MTLEERIRKFYANVNCWQVSRAFHSPEPLSERTIDELKGVFRASFGDVLEFKDRRQSDRRGAGLDRREKKP